MQRNDAEAISGHKLTSWACVYLKWQQFHLPGQCAEVCLSGVGTMTEQQPKGVSSFQSGPSATCCWCRGPPFGDC
eukprot:1153217-Pelagomonas_calceolata.AAC.2